VRSKFSQWAAPLGWTRPSAANAMWRGVHLLDLKTNEYNRPFLTSALDLVSGYGRLQGIVFRPGDARFEGHTAHDAIANVINDPAVRDGQPAIRGAARAP